MSPKQSNSKRPIETPIKALVDRLGEKDTRTLLGVHYNTLYKWRAHSDGKPDGRKADRCALNLCILYIYLLDEMEWTIEQLHAIKESNDSNWDSKNVSQE